MKRNHLLAAAVIAAFATSAFAAGEAKNKEAAQGAGAPHAVKQPFEKLDKDKDGFLGHSETAADRDAASRFHELDTDKDQKVSRTEYDAWQKGGSAAAGATARDALTIKLKPQSGSGLSGTATLTPQGEKTKVVLELSGAGGVAHPAHIHAGSCAKLDAKPRYGLESVRNGSSTTVVNAPLEKLLEGENAINVHKSADAIQTYVACGNLDKG